MHLHDDQDITNCDGVLTNCYQIEGGDGSLDNELWSSWRVVSEPSRNLPLGFISTAFLIMLHAKGVPLMPVQI